MQITVFSYVQIMMLYLIAIRYRLNQKLEPFVFQIPLTLTKEKLLAYQIHLISQCLTERKHICRFTTKNLLKKKICNPIYEAHLSFYAPHIFPSPPSPNILNFLSNPFQKLLQQIHPTTHKLLHKLIRLFQLIL